MRGRIFPFLTIISAGIIAYLCALQSGFLSIDDVGMTQFVSQVDLDLKSLLVGGASTYYRPLAVISYVANYSLFYLDPFWFHAVNLGLHLANALLVHELALVFFAHRACRERAALLAALFFLLNPLNTEAVIWVSARPDLLCTLFFILSVLLLLRHGDDMTPRTLVLFAVAYLASLAGKESSIALVLVVPLYLAMRSPRFTSKNGLYLGGGVFATTCVYLLLRAGSSLNFDRGVGSLARGVMNTGGSGVQKGAAAVKAAGVVAQNYDYPSFLDAMGAYGFYLRKLVFPFPLSFTILEYDHAAGLLCFALGVAAAWFLLRRFPETLLPLLIIFAGIVPPLLAYLGRIPWTPFGERYLYLPMVGFSLLVSLLVTRIPRMPSWVPLGAVLLLALPTISRAALWSDGVAFWEDNIKNAPGFAKSYSALGVLAYEDQRYDDAERYMKRAQTLGFNEPVIWKNLARVYLAKGDYARYEQAMRQAASRSQQPNPVYGEMILALMTARGMDERTRFEKAIKYHLIMLKNDPAYFDAYYYLGRLYYAAGDVPNAERYIRRYAQLAPRGEYATFAAKMLDNLAKGKVKLRPGLQGLRGEASELAP